MTQRRRTPLGREIRTLCRPDGKVRFWARWRETEFGRAILRAAHYTAHETEARGVTLRRLEDVRGRRLLALALLVAECRREWQSAGWRTWQPLWARRLRCSVRTVQRDLDALEAAGLFARWQPPHASVPEWMRSRRVHVRERDGAATRWAYCVYRWAVRLPAELEQALKRWRVGRSVRTPSRDVAPIERRAISAEDRARYRELGAATLAALGIRPPPD